MHNVLHQESQLQIHFKYNFQIEKYLCFVMISSSVGYNWRIIQAFDNSFFSYAIKAWLNNKRFFF